MFYRPNILINQCPINCEQAKYFDVLGKIIILALKEDKRINLDLNKNLFKTILMENNANNNFNYYDLNIFDLLKIYPNDHYLTVLFRLFNIHKFYQHLNTYSYFAKCKENKVIKKCESYMDLMGLTLNTPTFNISLSSSNKEELLTMDNLEKYLIEISNYFLNDGIFSSNHYIQSGMKTLVRNKDNCCSLFLPFNEYEFETLIIGSNTKYFDNWTPKYLSKCIKLEQYSVDTPVIKNLFDLLCNEFNIGQKRQFIRFLTGSLSLPIGGINKLNPNLQLQNIQQWNKNFYIKIVNMNLFHMQPHVDMSYVYHHIKIKTH